MLSVSFVNGWSDKIWFWFTHSTENFYHYRGSQTRFGGMRDLPFSVMIFATRFELKTRAGSGNYTYERERDLVFLWLWDAGFVRGIERDTGFQFLRDLIICPAQKLQAND